jgi:hypothetical protein
MPTGMPRPTRIGVSLKGTLTRSDERKFAVQVRNLSAAGCKVDLPASEALLEGESVVLVMDGSEKLPGQVRWTSGTQAGVYFLLPPPTL